KQISHGLRCFFDSSKQRPPTLPEIGREAPATVSAPLVVSLPWRVTARCPIVDPDLAPGRSAIPVRVAAMVLTARRLLRFLVLGRSNSILRLRRARGRDRCLARPRRIVALGAGAGGEKRCVDAARRWSGAATESNGSDCWAIVPHPNHARLAQFDGNTVAFGPGVADTGRLVRGGLRTCDDEWAADDGGERCQARSGGRLGDGCLISAFDRRSQLGCGNHSCADPRDDKTRQ